MEEKKGPSCQECGCQDFFENDGETVCLECRSTISFEAFDGENLIGSGSTDNDSGNTSSSSLLPDISSKISIQGMGNKTIQRMFTWNKVSYKEKQLLFFYNLIYSLYSKYLIKYALVKANVVIPNDSVDIERLKTLAEINSVSYQYANKKLIEKTIYLYNMLSMSDEGKKNFCQRQNNKVGIIAYIFYYINKEYNEIYTKNELSKIFNIDKKVVQDGNNHINKVLKKNPNLRHLINKRPVTLDDLIAKLDKKFPRLTDQELKLVKKYASRIKNTTVYLKGPPSVLLTGILMNLIRMYNFTINEKDLKDVYDHSLSTLNKYEKKLKAYIY